MSAEREIESATRSENDERAHRFAERMKLVLFNLLCAVVIFLVAVHIPSAANLSAIRKEVMVTGEEEIARFVPNLRHEPYMHSKLPGMGIDYNYIRLSTNAEGFRDYDHSVDKPSGSFRLVFLGDSFIFGLGLNQDETLPALLEAELQAGGGDKRYEVMNFALPGINLQGMGRITQTFALKYDPDLAIYSFICDDISATDSITHTELVHWIERNVADMPRWMEDLFVAFKMIRYTADYRMMSAIPAIYQRRLRVVLDYLTQLSEAGGYEIVIVDFCGGGRIQTAIDSLDEGRADVIHLIADFPYELNSENGHPTASSNVATAKLIAPLVRQIANDPATEER